MQRPRLRIRAISTHAPVKGATKQFQTCTQKPSHFNSRTREGCDPASNNVHVGHTDISTHAPVKGATLRTRLRYKNGKISTHAPVKGATLHHVISPKIQFYFNSRTREGCDHGGVFLGPVVRDFNSRTREGCDLLLPPKRMAQVYFNSRTREGCDHPHWFPHLRLGISTHAPVKGATVHYGDITDTYVISTHAPVKGATYLSHSRVASTSDFNSRTREGCDLKHVSILNH